MLFPFINSRLLKALRLKRLRSSFSFFFENSGIIAQFIKLITKTLLHLFVKYIHKLYKVDSWHSNSFINFMFSSETIDLIYLILLLFYMSIIVVMFRLLELRCPACMIITVPIKCFMYVSLCFISQELAKVKINKKQMQRTCCQSVFFLVLIHH